jgi:hypothetical protein
LETPPVAKMSVGCVTVTVYATLSSDPHPLTVTTAWPTPEPVTRYADGASPPSFDASAAVAACVAFAIVPDGVRRSTDDSLHISPALGSYAFSMPLFP